MVKDNKQHFEWMNHREFNTKKKYNKRMMNMNRQ